MSDSSDMPPAKKLKIEDEAQNSQDSQTYGLHVTPEEVEKLREFQVLDEVKSDDEGSNDEGSDKSDSSDELPEEEIEKMLEEDLPEDFKGAPKPKEKKYVKRQKIVLEEKGINYFEVLPLDWMMVRHSSGMPVYMHRASRVCTLSKPYFLGKGNTRRHDIPISAIPCLAYRIALKEEQKQMEIDKKIAEQIKNGTWADANKPTDNQNSVNAETPEANDIDMEEVSQNEDSLISDVTSQKSDTQEISAVVTNGTELKCPYSKSQSKQTSEDNFLLGNEDSEGASNETGSLLLGEETTQNGSDKVYSYQNTTDDNQTISTFSTENSQNPLTLSTENSQNPLTLSTENSQNPLTLSTENSQNPITLSTENSQNPITLSTENSENPSTSGTENGESVSLGGSSVSHLDGAGARPVLLPGGLVMPPPRVESVNTSWKSQQLSAEELNDYCKKLFKFKEVHIMHFKRWSDRRKYTKARKTMQYPSLPAGTKLITIPAQATAGDSSGKGAKRDWVMNMNGCSYLSVFHEYVRRALHKQPLYEFKQLENASAPYQATVFIGGMQYGVGQGSSKRQAKSQAARASIHILIPEMRDELPSSPGDLKLSKDDPDFTFFDYVSIEDPRIQEFCGAAAEPSPHAILRTCLLRNFGAGDRHITTEMKKLEFQKISLTMSVGKHSATVVCKNKKQAKQRASQAILQQLHPHITSWGSLLRLYGSRSMKSCKEKKLEEQQITLLQDKARHNEPNHAVLEKLRNEMMKLKERDNAVVPIGTLMVSEDLPTHSGSNLNNVDL